MKNQEDMFGCDAEMKSRQFKLRVGCILQYLDDERDSPVPMPIELSTGRVIGDAIPSMGDRA